MPAATKVLVVNGHPDSRGDRLCAALAEAYAEGAEAGGLKVRRLAIGDLTFPILRTAMEFSAPAPEGTIRQAQDDIAWADHVVIVHPLWLGGEPALLKAFLEQVLRYGFALDPGHKRLRGLLKGRSIRLIVTMGTRFLALTQARQSHGGFDSERAFGKSACEPYGCAGAEREAAND